jgi:hypothetical protein
MSTYAESDDERENSVHVIPHADGWAVRPGNSQQPSFVFKTRFEAREWALSIARDQGGSVIVHSGDNRD